MAKNYTAFWSIIEKARKEAPSDADEFCDAVQAALSKLPLQQVIDFEHTLFDLRCRMYSYDLWGAAYIMNGGCSDDGFDYWQCWLIAQGQAICEAAIANPESLASAKLRYGEPGNYDCEMLMAAATEVYENKTGAEEIPDDPAGYASIQPGPTGKRWSEDSDDLERLYPKLFKRFKKVLS